MAASLMASSSALLAVIACFAIRVFGGANGEGVNLLNDPSFELNLKSSWKSGGCVMSQDETDRLHGRYSFKCGNRKSENNGPIQEITKMVPGGRYAFNGYVKLLHEKPSTLWQNVKVTVQFEGSQLKKKKISCKGLRGEEKKKCRAEKRKLREELKKEEKNKRKNKGGDKGKKNKKKGDGKKNKSKNEGRKKKSRGGEKEKKQRGERVKAGTGKGRKTPKTVSTAGESVSSKKRRREQRIERKRRQALTRRDRRSKTLYPGLQKKSGTSDTHSYIIAYRGFVTKSQGWIPLVGNINAPMQDFTKAKLSIRGPEAGIDFLLDNLTLWEVPEHPDWEGQARENIERYRKSNVHISVTLPPGVSARDVEIQVDLKKHLFAFGSKLEDDLITKNGEQERKFRELVYYLFNWATVGSYKWRFGKATRGDEPVYALDFSNAVSATDVLLQHGFKIRGHSILWGQKKNIPEDVLKLTGSDLRLAVFQQVRHIMHLAKGKLAQWDVQNEFIHGHYYEETLHDPNLTIDVFKLARQLDSIPKLYLNDFQAVTTGANTEDYHDLAMRFIKADTGIQGLGIQGHTKDYVKPDPTMMWKRIDRLAETGLELFMTEFDIPHPDNVVRADWLEDAIRAFFAHPNMSGVILWGFWNERQGYPNMHLVYGPNLQIDEPGQRWACLVKKEWSTHVTKNLAESGLIFDLRGFQGDYEVIVKKRGVPVQRETFHLGKTNTRVDIRVTSSNTPIQVPTEVDLVPKCVSHRGHRSLGEVNTKATNTNLTCNVHTSPKSSGEEGAVAEVTCEEGEVLTGCSSYQAAHSSQRRGERIVVQNGVAKCRAYSRANSTGVYAVARCCRVEGLKCDYREAGASYPMDGAWAEAVCPNNTVPFGCSAYSQYSDFDGVFPNATAKSCLAQSGAPTSLIPREKSGVIAGAMCCSGKGVRCDVVQSQSVKGARAHAQVMCPSGQVMTGCSVFAKNGKAGGALIKEVLQGTAVCMAFQGTDSSNDTSEVIAFASCCHNV